MLSVNIRNDFLLKISKLQDCPERETQVESVRDEAALTGIVSYESRIFSRECMERYRRTKEEGHQYIVLDHPVSTTCFVFGKSYSLLLLCGQA